MLGIIDLISLFLSLVLSILHVITSSLYTRKALSQHIHVSFYRVVLFVNFALLQWIKPKLNKSFFSPFEDSILFTFIILLVPCNTELLLDQTSSKMLNKYVFLCSHMASSHNSKIYSWNTSLWSVALSLIHHHCYFVLKC